MENRYTGIARMKNAAKKAKVAEPEFEFSGFFKATFGRNVQSLDSSDGQAMASDGQAIGTKDRKRAILREMASEGAIEKIGNTRYAHYVPKRPR